jgi:hypothetical protein
MLVALACIVAFACAGASLQRLNYALAPTALDAKALADAAKSATLDDVEIAVSHAERSDWELGLIRAIRERSTGDINEYLLELEQFAKRWERVPRVCASVATSFGFLLGSLALREGLLDPEPEHIDQLIVRAINVVAVGVAGAMVCVAVHFRAGRAAKSRLQEVDGLVERLEKLLPANES